MKQKKIRLRILAAVAAALLAQQGILFAQRADLAAEVAEPFGQSEVQAGAAYTSSAALARQELPRLRLCLSGLEQSGQVLYCGIDLAVLEEKKAPAGDPNDADQDGKVFGVKDGKVKRFLNRNTDITVDLGDESDYRKGVRYRLAMRTLYIPPDETQIVIADQGNGKDGWVMLEDSEFILSFFAESGEGGVMVRHTKTWDENRLRYNDSKLAAGKALSRPYHMFWSGEKLMLEVETTEHVGEEADGRTDQNGVEITLYEKKNGVWQAPYPPVLLSEASGEDGAGASGEDSQSAAPKRYGYKGSLWHKDMIHRWGQTAPETILFTAVPVVGGERVTEDRREETIVMDDRELFFRVHQKSE